MAEGGSHELIIVRRHEEEEHAAHSSAWKVAHADFMTAMMAFFLIMWLINVTDDTKRKGIAQYFNPIHMSQGSTELKGLSKSDKPDKSGQKGASQTPMAGAVPNLLDLTAGSPGGKPMSPDAAAAALNAAAEAAAKLAAAAGLSGKGAESGDSANAAAAIKAISDAAAALKPANGGRDKEAFQDPYAVLAKLEQQYVSTQPTSVDVVTGDARAEGMPGGEIERDPFDPSYWQMVPLAIAKAGQPSEPGTAQPTPAGGKPDAAAAAPGAPGPASAPAKVEMTPPPAMSETAPAAQEVAAPPPAAVPAAKAVATPDKTAAGEPQAGGEATVAAATVARSTEIAKDIKQSVATMMEGKASPNLAVAATAEGVAISLTDDADYAMFDVGSAVPAPKTVVLLEHIAKVLADQKGQIVIRGYTDGRPFHSADYDNWRLSAARAQMAYYALVRGGLDDKRITAIAGYADRDLKNPADPYAAENRRIEILVKDVP